jgi:hypothetical protein
LFALRLRDDYQSFDHGGPWQKLRMALAGAGDGVTSGCCSLVEGILMMFLQFDLMNSIPPSQAASLGGLALRMPL